MGKRTQSYNAQASKDVTARSGEDPDARSEPWEPGGAPTLSATENAFTRAPIRRIDHVKASTTGLSGSRIKQ